MRVSLLIETRSNKNHIEILTNFFKRKSSAQSVLFVPFMFSLQFFFFFSNSFLKKLLLVYYNLKEGELAQMVERSLSMREVRGSMPRFSTF